MPACAGASGCWADAGAGRATSIAGTTIAASPNAAAADDAAEGYVVGRSAGDGGGVAGIDPGFECATDGGAGGVERSSGVERAPKIVVLDFATWDDQWRPFGAWLADNLSATWAADGGGTFAMIDRAQLTAVLRARRLTARDEFESRSAVEVAQALGADILVVGRYSALDKDLGLTVNVRPAVAAELPRPILFVQSRLAMSADMSGHLGETLAALGPTQEANIWGKNGISYPTCKYCPAAEYSEQGRKKRIQGTVTLTVLVTAEGRASAIKVTKSLEPSLDQQAVKAVGAWIFEPARDASGAPVPVRQAIQVTFHVY